MIAGTPRYRNILLRDFRTVRDGRVVNFNIGIAAHCPGTLAVLKKYLPDSVKFTVWADAPLVPELVGLMHRRFPEVPVVWGDLENSPSSELLRAVDAADLYLISSGSTVAGSVYRTMEQFFQRTGKSAGAYATGCTSGLIPVLDKLEFAWQRDPVAAEIAQASVCPVKGWAPDAVFDFDAADIGGAENFMQNTGLEPGKFICCIPGHRFTPRWNYFDVPADAEKIAVNAEFEEHDNAPLRDIITLAVKEYGLKVLICPEQFTEISLIRPRIFDLLPAEIQASCVPMDSLWSPDLALGVYRASRGVFGVEMHSQVMAVGNGVPGVLLRHPQFGSKSEMWKSIGVAEWLIDAEAPDYSSKALSTVRDILEYPGKTAEKLRRARAIINSANADAVRRSFLI